MNVFKRAWLDRKLKRALARHGCRLDSGLRGLREQAQLLLEPKVKLHNVKVYAKQLRIGAYTDIVSGTELRDVAHIGRYCSIGANCVIGQNRHSHPLNWLTTSGALGHAPSPGQTPTPTSIGHDVWIGRDVMIMSGVTIGVGAVVGAQSLVTKNVPPYAVVAGSPARVIRYRFDQPLRDALLASNWWNVPRAELLKVGPRMHDPEAMLGLLPSLPKAAQPTTLLKVQVSPWQVGPSGL